MASDDKDASSSSDPNDNDEYKKCFLFDENKVECGPCIQYKRPKTGVIYITNLNADVGSHLRNFHFHNYPELDSWNERKLIENRYGNNIDDQSLICEFHRNYYGVGWRHSLHCAHPDHAPYKRGMKTKKTELAPIWLVKELNEHDPNTFPVGGRVCRAHTPPHPRKKQKTAEPEQTSQPDESICESEPGNSSFLDESYQPEEIFVPEETQTRLAEAGNQLTSLCQISPIRYQVVKSPVNEISRTAKTEFRNKLLKVQENAVKLLAESLAPNQGAQLIAECLENDSDSSESDDLPPDLRALAQSYKDTTDKQARIVILSLVDHSKYSKKMLRPIFGCSDRSINTARKLRNSAAGLVLPTKVKFKRNRLNMTKANHFIEFLFSSGMVQDVAYGVSNIRFESGIIQTIPNAILTSKYSLAISLYCEICTGCNYEPLSRSTLWRILNQLKPSKRRSLQGLDDITAAGMNGFSHLEEFLKKRKIDQVVIKDLERAKRYLKTKYQSHCSTDSDIPSHNSKYALSEPAEEPQVGNFVSMDIVCNDCYNLISTLQKIINLAEEESNDAVSHDVDVAVKAILTYMKHQMRDQQQRLAKAYAFDNLNDNTGFWLKDFAQKVIPFQFREGQREYFGKKGMSLHIDVFFRKDGDDLIKQVYLTCLFACKQTATDVLNIGDNVLKSFKSDTPTVSQLFAKSDNATCYHGNFIFEAIYQLCKSRGFKLIRYDFNEPCKGKDQCDRESAGAKTVLNSCVDSGGKVKSAEQMYDALHHGQGIKNTQVSVIESNHSETSLTGTKIKNVSSYHSIKYLEEGMQLYKYFDIGPGVQVKYGASKFSLSYSVAREFSHTQSEGVRDHLAVQQQKQKEKGKTKKKRSAHQTCALIFVKTHHALKFLSHMNSMRSMYCLRSTVSFSGSHRWIK